MSKISHLENKFFQLLKQEKIPLPEKEYKFDSTRKWRFDFAYPKIKLAIEIEGAVWTQGRHTRGSGFIKDCEKYNQATLLGWRLLRYHADSLGQGVDDLIEILNNTTLNTVD